MGEGKRAVFLTSQAAKLGYVCPDGHNENTSFTQGTNGLWQKKTHSLLWVTLCQTSWWDRICFASCSDHQLKGFIWEGIVIDIKMMRSGARVVLPFTSSSCGRPITQSFRPEQLLSEPLLECIAETRQTSQRVVPCGQWFLPKTHWHPGTLTSVSVCRQHYVAEFSASSLPAIFLPMWSFHILLPSASPKHLIPPATVSTFILLQ